MGKVKIKGGHRKDNPRLMPKFVQDIRGFLTKRYVKIQEPKKIQPNKEIQEINIDLKHNKTLRFLLENASYHRQSGISDLKRLGIINEDNTVNTDLISDLLGRWAGLKGHNIKRFEVLVSDLHTRFTLYSTSSNLHQISPSTFTFTIETSNIPNPSHEYIDLYINLIRISERHRGQYLGLEAFINILEFGKRLAERHNKNKIRVNLEADVEDGYYKWLEYGFIVPSDIPSNLSDELTRRGQILQGLIYNISDRYKINHKRLMEEFRNSAEWKEFMQTGKPEPLKAIVAKAYRMKFNDDPSPVLNIEWRKMMMGEEVPMYLAEFIWDLDKPINERDNYSMWKLSKYIERVKRQIELRGLKT